MKTVICDIDGTVANNSHRQHFLKIKPRNWMGFKELAYEDTPYEDIISLVKTLRNDGNRIVMCTARTENEREITTQWLNEKAGLNGYYAKLYMRKEDDYRDDSIVKLELLEQIREDGYDPWLVLDDRDKVVEAFRSVGLRVLQVQPGNF